MSDSLTDPAVMRGVSVVSRTIALPENGSIATLPQAGLLLKVSASVQSAWNVASVGGEKAYAAVALRQEGTGGNSLAIFDTLPVDARYGAGRAGSVLRSLSPTWPCLRGQSHDGAWYL